jgi:hypothetical protein
MKTPLSNKSPEMVNTLEQLFPETIANIRAGKCVNCEKQVMFLGFRNLKSEKEFEISGICQPCQDEIFGID